MADTPPDRAPEPMYDSDALDAMTRHEMKEYLLGYIDSQQSELAEAQYAARTARADFARELLELVFGSNAAPEMALQRVLDRCREVSNVG